MLPKLIGRCLTCSHKGIKAMQAGSVALQVPTEFQQRKHLRCMYYEHNTQQCGSQAAKGRTPNKKLSGKGMMSKA